MLKYTANNIQTIECPIKNECNNEQKNIISWRNWIFGNGKLKANPIHGEDLAKECINQINANQTELKIGGSETLTQNKVAEIAFEAIHEKVKAVHLPD